MTTSENRAVAVFLHPTRPEAVDAAAAFISGLAERGLRCQVSTERPERVDELRAQLPSGVDFDELDLSARQGFELVVVFGGDGSILSGAEFAVPRGLPLLGVNLGHVGFLAELDLSETSDLVDKVVSHTYEVERRLTLAVSVRDETGALIWESFAINEVSVEKAARERMLEVMATVDHKPLSRWGCDGVLVSTPTGSTAYAFSAGGPVMWPDVSAMLLVPLSAHALFNRSLVLSPGSRVDLDVSHGRDATASVWVDGRRSVDAQPGSRVTVVRGSKDLLIARLAEQPFTTRLVKKFRLPVEGFRGGSQEA